MKSEHPTYSTPMTCEDELTLGTWTLKLGRFRNGTYGIDYLNNETWERLRKYYASEDLAYAAFDDFGLHTLVRWA